MTEEQIAEGKVQNATIIDAFLRLAEHYGTIGEYIKGSSYNRAVKNIEAYATQITSGKAVAKTLVVRDVFLQWILS